MDFCFLSQMRNPLHSLWNTFKLKRRSPLSKARLEHWKLLVKVATEWRIIEFTAFHVMHDSDTEELVTFIPSLNVYIYILQDTFYSIYNCAHGSIDFPTPGRAWGGGAARSGTVARLSTGVMIVCRCEGRGHLVCVRVCVYVSAHERDSYPPHLSHNVGLCFPATCLHIDGLFSLPSFLRALTWPRVIGSFHNIRWRYSTYTD